MAVRQAMDNLKRGLVLVLGIPLSIVVFEAAALIWGEERAVQKIRRAACRLNSHSWADETRWGIEPVCLTCGERRD